MTFFNIYFNLFIILFILHLFIKKHFILKVEDLKNNPQKSLDIYFKNKNVVFSFFIVIFYVFITILPFLYIRITRIGYFYDLSNLSTCNLEQLFYLIFILLSLVYYFKIANVIVYFYIMKLHFYLLYNFTFYRYISEDFIFFKESLLWKYTGDLMIFFNILSCTNRYFMESYTFERKLDRILDPTVKVLKRKWLLYLHIRYYIKRFFVLKVFSKFMFLLFKATYFHISRFVYYIPYSLVALSLLYDFHLGSLSYVYYTLLYLYVTNIVKKIREFYYEKDPLYDNQLAKYLYSNEEAYIEYQKFKSEKNYSVQKYPYPDFLNVTQHLDEIITYIQEGCKIYYVTDIVRATNEKYIMNNYKRLHVICLLFVLNIYFLYYNKISLIIFNIQINICCISLPLLVIIYYIHRGITEETKDYWIENIKAKRIYNILIIPYIGVLLFLFFCNKLTVEPQDIILNIQNVFFIRENFTLSEKLKFLDNYTALLAQDPQYDITKLEQVCIELKKSNLKEMTLNKIKELHYTLYQKLIYIKK